MGNPESARKMPSLYQSKCSSRGRGHHRNKFDWAQAKQLLYTGREVRRGCREVMMHKEKFKKFMEAEGRAEETEREWRRLKETTDESLTDNKGPESNPSRLPVNVEDYIDRSNFSGSQTTRELAEKAIKNPNAKQVRALDDGLHDEQLSWSDPHFRIGERKAVARNSFVIDGHACSAPSEPPAEENKAVKGSKRKGQPPWRRKRLRRKHARSTSQS